MTAPPTWFRIVALLAVVWNVFGVAVYLSSVGVFCDSRVGLNVAERTAVESIPAWITGAFAIGTFAGLTGSVGLLLYTAWARPVLIVSLIMLLLVVNWTVFGSGALDAFGGLGVPLMVNFVGAALILCVAALATWRGWLGPKAKP